MKKANYRLTGKLPSFDDNTSLLVFWNENLPEISNVLNNLLITIEGETFCHFNPLPFHSINGVVVSNNVASAPEITFWHGKKRSDIVILTAAQPQLEQYRFFTEIIDFTKKKCNVKTIYTIGSFYGIAAHKSPRELTAIYNNNKTKASFKQKIVSGEIDYISQGFAQRPSASAFLSWVAMKQNMPAINLWVTMPFYLSSMGDIMGQRAILSNIEKIFDLKFDYRNADTMIKQQYNMLEDLCKNSVDANDIIERIAIGDNVTDEETGILLNEINDFFSKFSEK